MSAARVIEVASPYFEDLTVGQVFDDAPAVTLTVGHATWHEAVFGDRLRLALDRELSRAVTGCERPLAHPTWAGHHFWLATIGIVLYTVAMWAAGLMEGLQWRALNDAGQLANPLFLDITLRLQPFLWLRLIGGTMYLAGAVMMAINFWQTIRGPDRQVTADPVAVGAD